MTPDQKNDANLLDLLGEEKWRIKAEALLAGCLNEKATP